MDWIQRLFRKSEKPPSIPTKGGEAYITKVQQKMDKLVNDFASGSINRTQFQELYSHYQREIQQIESILTTDPEKWETASSEGKSLVIRRQHMARAQAYAIYANDSGLPLATLGNFKLDPALIIPMLSAYRSATQEIFGAGMRFTQVESGQWLCFVPGEYTTMLAVFTNEPASKQLEYLEQLHHHFEDANQPHLINVPIDVNMLIYPHEYFLGKWKA